MKALALLTLAAASVLALPAHAQFAKPEDAVKYRQSALSVMGTHFSRIGAMASGRAPFDAKAAVENAQIVHDLSRLPWAGFGPGTDKISARAKPEIWAEQAKFKDHSEKMMAETTKLLAAAKTQNRCPQWRQRPSSGCPCKACHDNFRAN